VRFIRDRFILKPFSVMPRELDRVGVARQNKRPPLIKSAGCCLMLDPHYSSSNMYLGDEGTYVCKAFSPRSYVIQKVCVNTILTCVCHTLSCFFPVIVLLLIARDSSFFLRCGEEDPLRGCCVKEEDRSIHAVAGVEAFGWADTFDRGCATGIPYFIFIFLNIYLIFYLSAASETPNG
jgi:hypothetical protein